jgi:hypothetical protein
MITRKCPFLHGGFFYFYFWDSKATIEQGRVLKGGRYWRQISPGLWKCRLFGKTEGIALVYQLLGNLIKSHRIHECIPLGTEYACNTKGLEKKMLGYFYSIGLLGLERVPVVCHG